MLLRCRILRARGYSDKVLCAQRCERLLCHLSGSRDCVHCLSIDEEWSLHDAMLVHAFCFLQETVHAQRKAFGKAQRQLSRSPVTPNNCTSSSASFYDSLPTHAASCHLDFARWLCLRYLVCMSHRARGPGRVPEHTLDADQVRAAVL